MVDDTCYFLPCETEGDAQRLADLLNSDSSRGFFRAFAFWDAKRPITAQLLACLDLARLAEDAGAPLPIWPKTQQTELVFGPGAATKGAKQSHGAAGARAAMRWTRAGRGSAVSRSS